eukprot:gene18609-22480_t
MNPPVHAGGVPAPHAAAGYATYAPVPLAILLQHIGPLWGYAPGIGPVGRGGVAPPCAAIVQAEAIIARIN